MSSPILNSIVCWGLNIQDMSFAGVIQDQTTMVSFSFFFQEIVTALSCGKNIVPIIDGFEWPEPQALPEDMQAVLTFNGIK